MGNKDDGDAPGGHTPDGGKQGFRFLLREYGGGLIQDQQLELVLAELPGDFRKLFVPDGHIMNDHGSVNMHAHLFDGFFGFFGHFFPIQGIETVTENLGDHAFLFRLPVQQDILSGRKAGNEGEFLVDHADASGQRLKRRLEFHLLSVQKDIAAVSAGIADYIHSEKDFHQGGLAGAVFADQAEHFTFPQGKVDVRQYLIAEEILLDVLHFQKRCALTHLHSVLII